MQYQPLISCLDYIKPQLFPNKNKKELSKVTPSETFWEYYDRLTPDRALVIYGALSELIFRESNKLSIFPNSCNLIDTLLRANLGTFDFDSIHPPSNSFAVIMPRGYKSPDGVSIPSFIVYWDALSILYNRLGYEGEGLTEEGEKKLSSVKSFISVMACNDPKIGMLHGFAINNEIKDIYSWNPKKLKIPLEDDPHANSDRAQKTMIKIAISIAVFNSAYRNFLSKGLPKGAKIGKLTGGTVSSSVIIGNDLVIPSTHRSSHLRCFHFRQLRHQKYYKGEYADQPIGSRWIPVSETWVGDDIDAYTAKNLN